MRGYILRDLIIFRTINPILFLKNRYSRILIELGKTMVVKKVSFLVDEESFVMQFILKVSILIVYYFSFLVYRKHNIGN